MTASHVVGLMVPPAWGGSLQSKHIERQLKLNPKFEQLHPESWMANLKLCNETLVGGGDLISLSCGENYLEPNLLMSFAVLD